ncbi:Protein jagged-1 [Trichoplax sp. H2]|nr:Protein jagged-1 [Trichoplax sp. H2]|eukprot:RDD37201.1 Protein jagged-1 [Trichoplax sp. H2]
MVVTTKILLSFLYYWMLPVLIFSFSYQVSPVYANPCSSNPCKYGLCQRLNDTSYLCQCDQGYWGYQCQYKPSDCKWSIKGSNASVVYPTGRQWKNQCNSCYCLQGKVICSQLWCGLTFCQSGNDCSETSKPCTVVPKSWCLSTSCSQYGYCSSTENQIVTDCIRNRPLQKCILRTVYIDISQFTQNITVESICQEIRSIRSIQYYTNTSIIIGCQSNASTLFQARYRQLLIAISSPKISAAELIMNDLNQTLSGPYIRGNLRHIIFTLPTTVPSFILPLLITGTALLILVLIATAWLIKRKYDTDSQDQIDTKKSELSNFIFKRHFSFSKGKPKTQEITANPIFVDENEAAWKRKSSIRASANFFRGVKPKRKAYEIRNSRNKGRGISHKKDGGNDDSFAGHDNSNTGNGITVRELTTNDYGNSSQVNQHQNEDNILSENGLINQDDRKGTSGYSDILSHSLRWIAGRLNDQSEKQENIYRRVVTGDNVKLYNAEQDNIKTQTVAHDNIDFQPEIQNNIDQQAEEFDHHTNLLAETEESDEIIFDELELCEDKFDYNIVIGLSCTTL